ncbi:GNAT family N-acetyltransferase [Bacillus pinisoli]|uniref:GNAT family N-acetyltransferase n=1 Tax=Bacillus pinisoli TaxID=2901866 RepID=UPI002342DF3B|nr:GNAT family N-acetyltransferase [Bacillus pinisoli]
MYLLETYRCFINPFEEKDYSDVKKLFTYQEVRRFLGGIRDEESIQQVLDDMLDPTENSSFYWVVREKQTDNFIGLVSLDPHHDGTYLELSYQLLPIWWGKGYATEVVKSIIQHALYDLNLSRLVAETQTANTKSCRLLERVGMQFESNIMRFGAEQAIYSISSPKGLFYETFKTN